MKSKYSLASLASFAFLTFTVSTAHAQTWNTTDGTWSTAGNWTPSTVPNAIGAAATIAPASNSAIDLTGGPFTVGTLNLGTDTTNTGNITLNNSQLIFQVPSGNASLVLRGATGQIDNVINSSILLNSNLAIDANSGGSYTKTIFAGSFDVNGKSVTNTGGRKSVVFNSLTGNSSSSITNNNTSGQITGITGDNSAYAGSLTLTRGQFTTRYNSTYTATASSLGTGLINLNTSTTGAGGLSLDGLRLNSNGAAIAFSTGGIQSNQTGTNFGNIGFSDSALTLGTAANYLTGTGNLRLGGDRGFIVATNLGAFSNDISGKVRLDNYSGGAAGTTVFRVATGFDLASAAALELGNGGLFATTNTTVTTANYTVVLPAVTGTSGQQGANLAADGGKTLKLTGNFADTAGASAQSLVIGRINNGDLANTAGTGTVELSGTGSLSNGITFIKNGNADPRLLLSNTSGTQTFSGIISGAVSTASLVRNGAGGTTILTNDNTYSGSTTVNAGTLVIAGNQTGSGQIVLNNAGSILQFGDGTSNNGSAANVGTLFVNSTGTVQINKTDGGTFSNAIASNPSAAITLSGINGTGTTNIFTATSYSNGGAFATNSLNAGAVLAFSSASGAIDLKGTNLTVGGAGDTLLTSAGQGFYSSTTASKVTKGGVGTLIYQGNQGYTGNTEIDAGAVRVDIAQTNSGTYFVGNGLTTTTAASLLLGGGSAGLTGGVTFDRSVSVNPGNGTSGNRIVGGTNTSGTNIYSGMIAMDGISPENRSATLTAASGGTVEFSNTISGAGQNVITSGAGIVVFSQGTGNSYSGTTTVAQGTLLVNNTSNSGTGTGTVSVSSGGILGGSGIISGATTIESGGKLNAGAIIGAIGTQTFSSGLDIKEGSIFSWDVANAATADQVKITGGSLANTGAGAIFQVVLGSGDGFVNPFWNTNQSWAIFTDGTNVLNTGLNSIFASFEASGGLADTAGNVTGRGQFTFNGSSQTLNWTAVPEPTSALAGLLLAVGLLRRRRA